MNIRKQSSNNRVTSTVTDDFYNYHLEDDDSDDDNLAAIEAMRAFEANKKKPSTSKPEDSHEARIPCEFCHELFDMDNIIIHQVNK